MLSNPKQRYCIGLYYFEVQRYYMYSAINKLNSLAKARSSWGHSSKKINKTETTSLKKKLEKER